MDFITANWRIFSLPVCLLNPSVAAGSLLYTWRCSAVALATAAHATKSLRETRDHAMLCSVELWIVKTKQLICSNL